MKMLSPTNLLATILLAMTVTGARVSIRIARAISFGCCRARMLKRPDRGTARLRARTQSRNGQAESWDLTVRSLGASTRGGQW